MKIEQEISDLSASIKSLDSRIDSLGVGSQAGIYLIESLKPQLDRYEYLMTEHPEYFI